MTYETKPKRKRSVWFLWWQVDPWRLREEVAKYHQLGLHKSARGLSMICLMVIAGLTALSVLFTHNPLVLVDAAIAAGLGLLVLGSAAWSKMVAMIYWTVEKAVALIVAVLGPSHGLRGLSNILWWAVFMHFFYLAYRVEIERRKPSLSVEEVFT